MKKEGTKKLVLKPWVKVALSLIIIILISTSIFMIYNGKNRKNDDTPKYRYNTNSNIDYKVYLLPNTFYEEEYLTKDKQYASSLINYIDVSYNYLYTGSLETNMNYAYDITATIIGEYENSTSGKSELWKKNYTLLESQSQVLPSRTTFDINQNIKIDFNKYKKIVDDFRKNVKLSIDAYLDVKLTVKFNNALNIYNSNIKGEDVLSIQIPLNESTIQILTDYKKENKKVFTAGDLKTENKLQVRIGVIMLIFSSILSLVTVPKILTSNKNVYLKTLNKIMKSYKDIIVEVENEFDFKDLEILDIKTFDDMVDIEEEVKSPILYYEMEKDSESWFVITTDKYLYRYILSKYQKK